MRRSGAVLHCYTRSALLTVLIAFALPPLNLSAGPIYSIQNLGGLGSGPAMVSGINAAGTVAGFVTNAQGSSVPILFSAGAANPLGGSGQANGLNDAGTVIGTSYLNSQAYVTEWSNGRTTNVGIAGYGTSINNAGEIAGGYQTSGGQLHAFALSNGRMIDLGTLRGGTWSSAYGVNSSGEIAGTSSILGGSFRAFFSDGGGLVNLGTFGGANSHAMAINDGGQVVGNAQTSRGFSNAFLWKNGALTNLGTLGGTQSYAYGINDAGSIVGYSWTSGNKATDGFLYSAGVMLDLNSLIPVNSGWTINSAYAINSSGDILGTGTFNGQSYAVELLPSGGSHPDSYAVPEPAALFLGGIGLLVIARIGRSKRKAPPSTKTTSGS